MKIIVDTLGGDKGPGEVVKGSILAIEELGVNITLIGNEETLKREIIKYDYPKDKIEIVNATEEITNEDEPTKAIRRKKNSSMVIGLEMLRDGLGDGFVSAGSTGALLSGGIFIVKRIKGIKRAALASVFPTKNGFSFLLDIGANADCKPEYLQQFAIMGSIYSEKVLGINSPKVGLINIGTEKGKGNQLVKDSYELLSNSRINFIGNLEARDIPEGTVDVMVCDGFIGNIVLKLTEGLASSGASMLKDEITKSFFAKLRALMLKPNLKVFKEKLDYREYGGAPLLGISKPVIKAHGSSDALAFKNAIRQTKTFIENDVNGQITGEINKIL
ncbi:MAG TPA: phosphate acyltransferase PlsX [Tissierellales bacterium]|nr:phosphate acyltransferase PlsX [Tissierellales bacterium]